MEQLRIITNDWKIVSYDEFLFVTIMNGGEDEQGQPLFVLVGVINLEWDHIVLYHTSDPQRLMEAFEDVASALDAKKPVVDLRDDEGELDESTIIMLPNKRNPDSDHLN